MKLWILFDSGRNPIPVLTNGELPDPKDLVCRFSGVNTFMTEIYLALQGSKVKEHNYQWLGPFSLPENPEFVPRIFNQNREVDEEYSLKDGPWGRSEVYYSLENPFGVFFYIPGYDEVPLEYIPIAEQCKDCYQNSGIGRQLCDF
jgi:hypothetical protein